MLLYIMLGAAGIILLFVICFFLVRLPIELEYFKQTAQDSVFRVRIFGVKVYESGKDDRSGREQSGKADRGEVEKSGPDDSGEQEKAGFSKFMEQVSQTKKTLKAIDQDTRRLLKYLKRKARCKLLKIHLDVGFDDAAATGIAAGAAYGVVYGVASLIYNTIGVCKMDIKVNPVFTKPCINLHIKGIFTAAPVHIIKGLRIVLAMQDKIENIKKEK